MAPLSTQPTVSGSLIYHIQRGDIVIRPNIARVDKNSVTFDDGSVTNADVILLATGFKMTLPFFSQEVAHCIITDSHHLNLYRNVFSPVKYFIIIILHFKNLNRDL